MQCFQILEVILEVIGFKYWNKLEFPPPKKGPHSGVNQHMFQYIYHLQMMEIK
jgi:hypothetical protein